jgi:hypothetical protein
VQTLVVLLVLDKALLPKSSSGNDPVEAQSAP